VLHNSHDAEDAFQATFLLLVRKGASIRPQATVGNWLYGVAYRTALAARTAAARRRTKEREVGTMTRRESYPEEIWKELQPVLDRELARLPDKYRAPIVLCDLESKTRKEAARQLGWTEGTLSGRLARARALLAKRLTRHCFPFGPGVVATVLAQQTTSAVVPVPLLRTAAEVATRWPAGVGLLRHAIANPIVRLNETVLKAMLISRLKSALVLLLILAGVACGAGILIHHTQAATQPHAATEPEADPGQPPVANPPPPKTRGPVQETNPPGWQIKPHKKGASS
jgi:RNA polymerase sigma-70 factor (ECF subfamily)